MSQHYLIETCAYTSSFIYHSWMICCSPFTSSFLCFASLIWENLLIDSETAPQEETDWRACFVINFSDFSGALIMRIKERWWQLSSLVGIHKHARMVKSSIICKNRLIDFCLQGRKAVNTKMSFTAPRQRFLFDEETECANTALSADELQRYSFCFISFKAFFPLTESAIIKRFPFKWMSHDFISGDKIWWSTVKYTATATALRAGNRLH